MDVWEVFEETVQKHGQQLAILDFGTQGTVPILTLTYQQFHDRCLCLAHFLRQNTLPSASSSTRILVMVENASPHVEMFFACARLGLTVVEINCRLSHSELISLFEESRGSLLLIQEKFKPIIHEVLQASHSLSTLTHIIWVDEAQSAPAPSPALAPAAPSPCPVEPPPSQPQHVLDSNHQATTIQNVSYIQILSNLENIVLLERQIPRVSLPWTQQLFIYFTSGTTGKPKMVSLSHKSMLSLADGYIHELGLTGHEVWGIFAPMYHHMVGGQFFGSFRKGIKHVLVRSFNPTACLSAIQHGVVTHTGLSATMISLLARYIIIVLSSSPPRLL